MNRSTRRKRLNKRTKNHPKHNIASITASNAQGILDNLNIPQLIGGVNNLLEQMRDRGVKIYDYDYKSRELYKLQMIRGKFYFLATEPLEESDE